MRSNLPRNVHRDVAVTPGAPGSATEEPAVSAVVERQRKGFRAVKGCTAAEGFCWSSGDTPLGPMD